MKLSNGTPYKAGRLGRLLSRRDWAYVLALLVPFVAYDLALKIVRVASLSDERDPDELRRRRHNLLEWRARVDAMYTPPPSSPPWGR